MMGPNTTSALAKGIGISMKKGTESMSGKYNIYFYFPEFKRMKRDVTQILK